MNAIVQYLVNHGYSVLFASVFARQMCLPVPALLFLLAAGALAGSGRLTLAVVLALAVIACVMADLVWYKAGRRSGEIWIVLSPTQPEWAGFWRLLCLLDLLSTLAASLFGGIALCANFD